MPRQTATLSQAMALIESLMVVRQDGTMVPAFLRRDGAYVPNPEADAKVLAKAKRQRARAADKVEKARAFIAKNSSTPVWVDGYAGSKPTAHNMGDLERFHWGGDSIMRAVVRKTGQEVMVIRHHNYYAWRPHFDKVWGALRAVADA